MIPNPYESPRETEPLSAPRESGWHPFNWPFELAIGGGQLLLLISAGVFRLQTHLPGPVIPELGQVLESFGLMGGLALIVVAGIRGLFFVCCRNQNRAVINGLLCVGGFVSFIGALSMFIGK